MSDFDLSSLDAQDEAQLAIRHPASGEPTTWIWTFYGPGHPRTIALADRVSKDALRKLAAQRTARINGKKWKDEDEQSLDQIRAENVDNILVRTSGFSAVSINGVEVAYSEAAARELLLDRKKGWLLAQVMEFLSDEASFMKPSAKA
jgi:ABC-type Fe3+-hydroxamate transport system substrate-binding protein